MNRFDFVLLFDVKDGNPNGDPDAGNLPRMDPETGQGLVTDVCVKRKVRNYVGLTQAGKEGMGIFVTEKAILNVSIAQAFEGAGIDLKATPKDKKDGGKRTKAGEAQGSEVDQGRLEMCRRYFDIRTFGAVMSTGANAGQVRGPVQLTFGRSIDPILTLEHSITRMAVTNEKAAEEQKGDNRTMGRKATVPYGLYRMHGFVSPALGRQEGGAKGTGFSDTDVELLWEALESMFEHDRSAARGMMATRALIVFEHDSELGTAPAHALFAKVNVKRKDATMPVRDWSDYLVSVEENGLDADRVKHVYKVKREKGAVTLTRE